MSATIDKLCTPMQSLLEGLNRFDPSDGFLASLKRMVSPKLYILVCYVNTTNNHEIIYLHNYVVLFIDLL